MKMFFKNTTSLFLSFLVLFSTMSLTINEHYCGDTLVDATLYAKASTCGMEIQASEIYLQKDTLKNECCINENILKEGQNELTIIINSLSFDQQLFVSSFIYTYLNLFEGYDNKIIPFKNYTPPLVVKDIQKLDETYLI